MPVVTAGKKGDCTAKIVVLSCEDEKAERFL